MKASDSMSRLPIRRLGITFLVLAAGLLLTTARPTTQDTGTVRFAVIGDFGKASSNELDVANAIRSWNPDFIITTGDNNYERGGADTIDANIGQYFHDFIAPYNGAYGAGSTTNRFFPSLGNHDWGDGYVSPPTVQPYTDYFTLPNNERYYDFVAGPVHLFSISSDGFEPDGNASTSTQGTWIHSRLAGSTSPWKLVYFHNPPYSSSAHASGNEEVKMRWPFRDWGVTAVFSGHHHDYERLLLLNIPYFVTGLGGNSKDNYTFPLPESQFRYNGDYGAMLVTASTARITFTFVTRTGVVLDSYSIDAPAGPGAPNNLVATGIPTGRVDLSWTDNTSDEQGFNVERSSDGITYSEIETTGANVTTTMDLSVAAAPAAYSYRVRAFRADGTTTAYSNVAVGHSVHAPPPAAVLTATAASSSAINLSWPAMAGVDGIRVYRDLGGVFALVATVAGDAVQYTDGGRAPATSYTYVVRGFNDGGESPSSNAVTATTLARLQEPTGLVATAVSGSEIDLAWTDASTGEDGFKILRSTDGVNFGVVAWVGPDVTTYANTGRTPSTTYYYRVRAYETTGGESLNSNTASATTLPPPPAPSGLTATGVSTSRIDLAWTDNSSTEATFRIYRSSDGVTFAYLNQVASGSTTYSNTGLPTSTAYYYRVTAREAGGAESAPSNVAMATTKGLPPAPTGLTATAVSTSQINLAWTDNSANETGFRIDRSNDGVTFSTLAWVGADATSYANTGRPAGTTYYYRVYAYNDSGYSSASNTASATTLAALGPPSGLTATAQTATQVALSWVDNSTIEAGFKIYRSTDGVTYTFLASVGSNVTTYTNGSALPATTYYYRVLAYDAGGGQSGYSNVAVVTTPPVPVAPSGLTAAAVSSSQINLAWSDNSSNESGFRIDRSTDGVNFSTVAWVGVNVTSYANTGRAAGTTYYYRVSAYNANGTSAPSNTASATTP